MQLCNVFLSKPWRAAARGWVGNSVTFALHCWDTYGLISDAWNNNDAIRIIRIVCPWSFWNSNIEDILSDPNFVIKENKGVLVLKRDHHEGQFTNWKLQMGLCGASFCAIAVFLF